MRYLHFQVCIFVTAHGNNVPSDGNNIPNIPILLPPRFAACGASSTLMFAFFITATITTFRTFLFFVTPSFCSLERNDLGPESGIAIAEALKINKTITDIK
jgi:hypothetical protein